MTSAAFLQLSNSMVHFTHLMYYYCMLHISAIYCVYRLSIPIALDGWLHLCSLKGLMKKRQWEINWQKSKLMFPNVRLIEEEYHIYSSCKGLTVVFHADIQTTCVYATGHTVLHMKARHTLPAPDCLLLSPYGKWLTNSIAHYSLYAPFHLLSWSLTNKKVWQKI